MPFYTSHPGEGISFGHCHAADRFYDYQARNLCMFKAVCFIYGLAFFQTFIKLFLQSHVCQKLHLPPFKSVTHFSYD